MRNQILLTIIASGLSGAASIALGEWNSSPAVVPPARALHTTAPITGGGDMTADRTLAIAKADSSHDGYLSSTDFSVFNAKVGTATTLTTTAPLAGGGDLSTNRTLSIPKATTSVDGYLGATDFVAFTGKVPSTRMVATTPPLEGGGNLGSNLLLYIDLAGNGTDGYLSATDWARFNASAPTIGSPVTGGTAGSALFVDGSGNLGQDNAHYFWDVTHARLGIGTNVPTTALDVVGTIVGEEPTRNDPFGNGAWIIRNPANSGLSDNSAGLANSLEIWAATNPALTLTAGAAFVSNGNVLGWSSSPTAAAPTTGISRLANAKVAVGNGTAADVSGTLVAANIGVGTSTPGAALDINGSVLIENEGHIQFNDTVSNNVQLVAPATVSASYQMILPTSQGAINQPLVTDGAGQLQWGTALTGFATTAAVNTDFNNIASKQTPSLVCETNQALTGDSTCDGQSLSANTYPQVLLAFQTDPTQNGIWCTAPGAWNRCGNMPDDTYTAIGATVSVAGGSGTTYDNTLWYVSGVGDGTLNIYQIPKTKGTRRSYTNAGSCTVASTTLSTTATNETCTGVPASSAVAVNCSGAAAFTTPTAGGLYCRATGTLNQIACNTAVANAVAMAYSCSWVQP